MKTRTTVLLDEDRYRRLRVILARERRTFTAFITEAIDQRLRNHTKPRETTK